MTNRGPIREIEDAYGDSWAVYEERGTEHGWEILLGRPLGEGPLNRVGGNRVILTAELVAYLESIRVHRGSAALPIGKSTYGRLRKVLGHNIYLDLQGWWESHADDLATLTGAEFAAKHGKPESSVSLAHKAMFGKRQRENGWWLSEPARSLLAGDAPRSIVAENLGISVGSVGRLRWMVRSRSGEATDST